MKKSRVFHIDVRLPIEAETQEEALRIAKILVAEIKIPDIRVVPRPTVYICDNGNDELALSQEPFESEDWDANHICLKEIRGGKATGYSTVRQILVNILTAAGVRVEE